MEKQSTGLVDALRKIGLAGTFILSNLVILKFIVQRKCWTPVT